VNVWKVVCATLVIFLAGIITGATLVRFAQVGPRSWRSQRAVVDPRGLSTPRPLANPANLGPRSPTLPSSAPKAPSLLSREFIQLLERRLELSSEQREQIGQIMREGQERIRELRSTIDPQLRKELQQTRERIRAVLSPEQREQFERMMKRPARRTERGETPGSFDHRLGDAPESHHPPPGDGPREGQPLPPAPER